VDKKHVDSHGTRWIEIALLWAGVALFDALQTVLTMRSQGMHHVWTALFVMRVLRWLPWALATPVVIRTVRRYSRPQIDRPSTWLAHLATFLGIYTCSVAWTSGLDALLRPWGDSAVQHRYLNILATTLGDEILPSLLLYAAIVAITLTLHGRKALAQAQTAAARLNEELSKEQLRALLRQLEPHFIFNTLNAIAGLVREQRNAEAVSMVAELSEFLRGTINNELPQVTLASELEYLQRYLAIQKMRFSDRLQVSLEVPGECLHAMVPTLVLQPLVENAIQHGIAQRADGGAIRVVAYHADGRLSLHIWNNGPRLPPEWDKSSRGIGLANVRRRLQLLYGSAFDLSLRDDDTGGVQALVKVPWRLASAARVA
jgi:two-component system, LytTR family, sensor kinase